MLFTKIPQEVRTNDIFKITKTKGLQVQGDKCYYLVCIENTLGNQPFTLLYSILVVFDSNGKYKTN